MVALAVVEPDRAHPARVIRPAVPEDRGAIVAFCRSTWGGENSDYIERVIDDWLTRDDGALAVAAIDGRAVGCAYVRLLSPHEAFVAGMRVHPAHRRSGLSLSRSRTTASATRPTTAGRPRGSSSGGTTRPRSAPSPEPASDAWPR